VGEQDLLHGICDYTSYQLMLQILWSNPLIFLTISIKCEVNFKQPACFGTVIFMCHWTSFVLLAGKGGQVLHRDRGKQPDARAKECSPVFCLTKACTICMCGVFICRRAKGHADNTIGCTSIASLYNRYFK
jgi:hypothetical protein